MTRSAVRFTCSTRRSMLRLMTVPPSTPIASATRPDHKQRRLDAVAIGFGIADVAADEQAVAVRDREQDAARRVPFESSRSPRTSS